MESLFHTTKDTDVLYLLVAKAILKKKPQLLSQLKIPKKLE